MRMGRTMGAACRTQVKLYNCLFSTTPQMKAKEQNNDFGRATTREIIVKFQPGCGGGKRN